ncbi:unnamed protein product, partial [Ixodes persulcatus]
NTKGSVREAVVPTVGVGVLVSVRGRPRHRLGRGEPIPLHQGVSLGRGGGTPGGASDGGRPRDRHERRREGGKANLTDRLGQEVLREKDILKKCQSRHAVHQHGRRPGGAEDKVKGSRNALRGME